VNCWPGLVPRGAGYGLLSRSHDGESGDVGNGSRKVERNMRRITAIAQESNSRALDLVFIMSGSAEKLTLERFEVQFLTIVAAVTTF
jgi:hypothetical protein